MAMSPKQWWGKESWKEACPTGNAKSPVVKLSVVRKNDLRELAITGA
jgi:hypothetical protein